MGSHADIVLPAKLLKVDTTAPTTTVTDGSGRAVTVVAEGGSSGDGSNLVVRNVGSGSHTFVLSAA